MRLVSIDAGLRGCGVAEFLDGKLTAAHYVPNTVKDNVRGIDAWREMALQVRMKVPFADLVVFEMMKIYSERQQKGSQADILELVGVISAIGTTFPRQTQKKLYTAGEWKGQVPKKVHNERVIEALSVGERGELSGWSKDIAHNVYDAVGIGLYELGRLKGGSAYARVATSDRSPAQSGKVPPGSREARPGERVRRLAAKGRVDTTNGLDVG